MLAIRWYLYGDDVDANRTPLTIEFDYRWKIVKDGQSLHDPSLRDTTKRWMALHLSVDREGADWVIEPKEAILFWGFLACVLFPQETDYFYC